MADEGDDVSPLERALDEVAEAPGSQYLVATLEAAFTSSHDREIFRDWRLQDQTELDLHLLGSNVLDHATRADWLGTFMRRSSIAVKELAKDIAGMGRHTPGLLVEGPGPGSVRVVLKSPPVQQRGDGRIGRPVETLDGKALHQFATLFLLAEDEDSELLEASVQRLGGRARSAMRAVGTAVLEASFEVEGTLAARGHAPERLTITPSTAARIVSFMGQKTAQTEERTISGEVDGWTWSRSVLEFLPESGAGFRAVVPPDLQERVAAINGQPDHHAVANFRVTTTYPAGDASAARHTYALQTITADIVDALPEP